MTVRIALVTRGEDVEGGFEVVHLWGGRDEEEWSMRSGREESYITRGGWGIVGR